MTEKKKPRLSEKVVKIIRASGDIAHSDGVFLLADAKITSTNIGNYLKGDRMKELIKDKGDLELHFWRAIGDAKLFKQLTDTVTALINAQTKIALEEHRKKAMGFDGDNRPRGKIVEEGKMLLLDLKTNDKLIFDANKGVVTNLHYKNFEDRMDNKTKQQFYSNAILAHVVYDPFRKDIFWTETEGGETFDVVNRHISPEWKYFTGAAEECEFFPKFLAHVFPGEENRSYVLHWMWQMMMGRNQTLLILNGSQGVGKSTFAEVCEALVGRSNYQYLGDGFFKSQFNAELANKRLVYIDEPALEKKFKEKVKWILHDYVTIEKKGRDVEGQVPNFASFILSNNHISDNYVEQGERRLSAPELGTERLDEVYPGEEIDQFKKDLKNPAKLKWIMSYIKLNRGKFYPRSTWQKEKYWQMTYNCLYAWKKYVIEAVLEERDEIDLDGLRKEYKETYPKVGIPQAPKVKEFLDFYRDIKGNRYAELKKVGCDNLIIPSGEYRAPLEEGDYLI